MTKHPLFSMTTAYKRMIDFHSINDSIFALVVYMDGEGMYADDIPRLCGVEQYKFPNPRYAELGTGLFNKLMDYENFLCREVVNNGKVRDLVQPWHSAFNIKYDDKYNTSWWKRFWAKRTMDNVEDHKVTMNPYEAHDVWSIQSDENPYNIVGIENAHPVFKSAYQQSSKDLAYVYELGLIKQNMSNVYIKRPCINIYLFDNTDAANQYMSQSLVEQQNFTKHKDFQTLQNKCASAIERFAKYTKTKNMSR